MLTKLCAQNTLVNSLNKIILTHGIQLFSVSWPPEATVGK